ncbi:MAG: flagellar hook-length control protein FliK [Liquorilactobacillus ghanensis]|uniref:flagellar hook-length control protein FliK n=1 Tax=Liquorilactobacillus ghanensis TaxID=399370 RepID=UPI0039ED42EA
MNAQIEITTAIKAKTAGKKKRATADQAKFNKALNKFHTSEKTTAANKLIKQFPKNNKSTVSSKQMPASKTTEQADVSDSMVRDNSFIASTIKPAADKTMSATTVNGSGNKGEKATSIIANSALALDSGLAIQPNLKNEGNFSESQVEKVNQKMIAKLEPLNSPVASVTAVKQAIQSTKLNNSADAEINSPTMTTGETKKNSETGQLQKNPELPANIASIGAAKSVVSGENSALPTMHSTSQTIAGQVPATDLSRVQLATTTLVKAVKAVVAGVAPTPNTKPIVAAQASTPDLPKIQTENQVKTTNVNASGNDLMQSAIALRNAMQGGSKLKSSTAEEKIENDQQLVATDKVSDQVVQVSDKNIASSNELSNPQSALPDQVIAAPVSNQNIENSFKVGQTSLLDLMQPEHTVQTTAKAPIASSDQKILFDSKVLQTAALNVAPAGKTDFPNPVTSVKQNLTWNTTDTGGQAQLINDLTKEISTLTIPGSKTVTIKLSPENMGNVEITMKAAQSQVSLEVKVQTTAAKQLLGTVMDKLEKVLQNQPYSADGNNAIKNATTVNQPNLSTANNTFFDFNGSQQQFTGRQSRHNFSAAAAKFADASPKRSAEVQQSDLRKSTISILA